MKLSAKSPLWRRAGRLLGRQLFRLAENNDDPRYDHNGEGWLVRSVLAGPAAAAEGDDPMVIFDGGANAGDYTREVLMAAQRADRGVEVHAFEPSPYCVDKLRTIFADEPAVRIVGAALADRKGEASLHDGRAGSSQASLMPREVQSGDAASTITVPLIRLSDYLEEQSVKHVDLLKLDIEGSELAALRGLGERLHPDIIDVIQFEYGGAALDAGTTLRDLFQLLSGRGYLLTKLFPAALEMRNYRPWMEHYAYANYVALSPRWLAIQRNNQ